MLDGDAAAVASIGERRRRDTRQVQRSGARFERRDQMPVLDIVAEGFETDLGGVKQHFGRADQPPRVVDDADFAQRRGVRQARLPHAERLKRRHRTGEQRRGAMIGCAGGAIRSVSTPAAASAIALTRPAGPPPIDGHLGGEVFALSLLQRAVTGSARDPIRSSARPCSDYGRKRLAMHMRPCARSSI